MKRIIVMDMRITLPKGCKLHFPGIECSIDASIGKGSNAIAYTGSYRDHQNPGLSHPVLIRELFPWPLVYFYQFHFFRRSAFAVSYYL